jgi:membrane protease YdiL (CAAX protease family)
MENEGHISRVEPENGMAAVPPEAIPSADYSAIEAAPVQEHYPFWGYADLLIFFFFALFGFGVVNLVLWVLHPHVSRPAFVLLPAQCLIYAFLFLGLAGILKVHYDQPFWQSLRWVRTRPGEPRIILLGFALAISLSFVGWALRIPDVQTPMKQLLSDRTSLLLVAIFAVTLGPVCEELVFRGFLQPVLVRSLGVVPGIVATAVPFGILHLPEYGNSWRHVLLITMAGAAFGWMRHVSGSTRAAAVMHAAFNFVSVVGTFAAEKNLPSSW